MNRSVEDAIIERAIAHAGLGACGSNLMSSIDSALCYAIRAAVEYEKKLMSTNSTALIKAITSRLADPKECHTTPTEL